MSKKNFKMTPEERARHDFAVKVRKMTDEQIYTLIKAPGEEPKQTDPAAVIADFIGLCEKNGRRMGPATISQLKTVALEAGYAIGI